MFFALVLHMYSMFFFSLIFFLHNFLRMHFAHPISFLMVPLLQIIIILHKQ